MQSILEEILANEQFKPHVEITQKKILTQNLNDSLNSVQIETFDSTKPEYSDQPNKLAELNQPIQETKSYRESDRSFKQIHNSQELSQSPEKNNSQELNRSIQEAEIASNEIHLLKEVQTRNSSKDSSNDPSEGSINIFEGINLDDSSINNYVSRLKKSSEEMNSSDGNINDYEVDSLNIVEPRSTGAMLHESGAIHESSARRTLFCGTNELTKTLNPNVNEMEYSLMRPRDFQEVLAVKDSTIAALTAELDSLREIASNTSTMSLNTTTTDYRQYHDEYQSKITDFQNALQHRDGLIQQLTESLQQTLANREELKLQSQHFAQEIASLQAQLAETAKAIRLHKCQPEGVLKESDVDIRNNEDISPDDISEKCDINTGDIHGKGDNRVADYSQMTQKPAVGSADSPSSPEKKKATDENQSFAESDGQQKIGKVTPKSVDLPGTYVGFDHLDCGDKIVGSITFEDYCSNLTNVLDASQQNLLNTLKSTINSFIELKVSQLTQTKQDELKVLKDELEHEKSEHDTEISRLRELLSTVRCGSAELVALRRELDAKHAKEMEELRLYFEQKCADVEKHYSEEIFSQQSRKLSECSSSSEVELTPDLPHIPGPGGDTGPPSFEPIKIEIKKQDYKMLTKQDLINLRNELCASAKQLEKYDLEDISDHNLNKIRNDLSKLDFRLLARFDLVGFKAEMQNKYHAELEILREDYENRIDLLNVEHEAKLQSLERRSDEKIESLKFELEEALRNNEISISSAVQEVVSWIFFCSYRVLFLLLFGLFFFCFFLGCSPFFFVLYLFLLFLGNSSFNRSFF